MAKTYIDKNGYRRFSDSNILVHRYIAEKKLGRPLDSEEVVHHKDRDKINNEEDNLWVCKDQDEHESYHEEDGDFDDEDDDW